MRAGYVLFGLALAGCSVHSMDSTTATWSQSLPRVAEAYKATGMPWEDGEFVEFAPTDSEDAGPLIRRLTSEMDAVKPNVNLAEVRGLAEGGHVKEATAMLAPVDEAFSLALQAADKRAVGIENDPDTGEFGHLDFGGQGPSKVAQLVGVHAELAAETGKTDEALRDLHAGFEIASFCDEEHGVMGFFKKTSAETELLLDAGFCQNVFANDPKSLEALLEVVDRTPSDNFWDAMRGAAYSSIAECRNTMGLQIGLLSSSGNPSIQTHMRSPLLRTGLPEEPGQRALMAALLQAWVDAAPAMENNDPDKFGAAIQHAMFVQKDPDLKQDMQQFLGMVASAATGELFVQARRNTLETMNDVLRYRDQHGQWPKSLSVFPYASPDPFTGKPLKMVFRKDGSVRIYSVGPDKKDNGGKTASELGGRDDEFISDKEFDVAVTYTPPGPKPTLSVVLGIAPGTGLKAAPTPQR